MCSLVYLWCFLRQASQLFNIMHYAHNWYLKLCGMLRGNMLLLLFSKRSDLFSPGHLIDLHWSWEPNHISRLEHHRHIDLDQSFQSTYSFSHFQYIFCPCSCFTNYLRSNFSYPRLSSSHILLSCGVAWGSNVSYEVLALLKHTPAPVDKRWGTWEKTSSAPAAQRELAYVSCLWAEIIVLF